LSKALSTTYGAVLIFFEEGKEKKKTVHYNAVPVKLPSYSHKLYLVAVKGFGMEPMMLLTSCSVKKYHKESVWRIVEYYLARWKRDESYRHIKQYYHFEDLRVRSYISIRNIAVLVLAVSYFASVYLGQSIKLKMLVERIFIMSKRFFGVPSFFNYVITNGIFNLLYSDNTALRGIRLNSIDDFQLCLDLR
jgi:hypothetical protein